MSRIYPGIDAHLNSYLQQTDGGWESFHAAHVICIQQALNTVLPDNYYALPEKSLQITSITDERGRRTRPDIGVFQQRPGTPSTATATAEPTLTLPLDNALVDVEETLTAVSIYRVDEGRLPGRLVTQIEVLSPANKPGGEYAIYHARRLQSLSDGVNLIEIDYLHRTRPVLVELPSYPAGDADATPYYLLVSIPHPTLRQGAMRLYSIGIGDPLPRFAVPLMPDESVALDMQAVYDATVTTVGAFQRFLDYTQPPVAFESFSAGDRAWIQGRIG